jgi:hypothetical protein
MKKLILLFAFSVLFFSVNVSFAQISETSMKDIIETVSDKIKYLEDKEDMEIVNITTDLLVGTKSEKYIYRYLDNQFDYKVLAFGDRRISGLKIEVRKKNDNDWILVDKTSGEKPTMEIYPDSRAFYEFTISVTGFKEDNTAGHFSVFIYHKDPLKK